jgi:hypothetical protein
MIELANDYRGYIPLWKDEAAATKRGAPNPSYLAKEAALEDDRFALRQLLRFWI